MASFATFSLLGLSFLSVGILRTLRILHQNPNPNNIQKPLNQFPFQTLEQTLISLISLISFLYSLSLTVHHASHLSYALHLQICALSSLFLLYSLTPFLNLPRSLQMLIPFFAFFEEFLVFYHQKKDSSGIENRYFSLMLVPIIVCIGSVLMEIAEPGLKFAKLGFGFGVVLQGVWFLQMGASFFTNWIADGCKLHERTFGDYTIKCRGHPEYHRGRAIATLQFNFDLAFVVILGLVVYGVVNGKRERDRGDYRMIGGGGGSRGIGGEGLEMVVDGGKFMLDSDEEKEMVEEGLVAKEEEKMAAVAAAVEKRNGTSDH